ncbi:MAG TPA: sigma-70 family RNA polymerase sigma factor [Chloroflexi bacterium]|nr:sigma-70 family RNA polymerase sigma factor [Chloroflexota bacterium]
MRVGHRANNSSDIQLVHRAQRGDKAAFGELFCRYERRIYGYLYRLVGNRQWAEDLTQEAFIRAHQSLNQLGPPYDFKSWIYRIAGNLAIDGLRRYKDEISLPDWDAGEASAPEPADEHPEADPEQEARREEVRQAVWRALHRLPENYRQILLLRELEGLSYREIAGILGVSLDNVKVTLHRARLAFRDLYGLQVMMEEGRGACRELDELLSAEIDGELDRSTRRRVKEHIASCPVCQRTRKELLAVSNLLALLAPVFPPPTLRPRFLQRLEELPPPRPVSPPPSPPSSPPSSGRGGGSEPGNVFWLVLLGVIGGLLLLGILAFATLAVFAPGPTPTPALPSPPPTDTWTPPPPTSPTLPPPSPSPSPSSPPSPSPSPVPPTSTPTPTPTPVTPTPTSTPTATPTPAASIAFWADATTVPAGSCTTVHWETANVAGVYFDGQGVAGVGSQQTCPCAPETHTLEVVLRDGTHEVRTLTIDVTGSCVTPTPTPDTVPPPAPQPIGPGTTDPNGPENTACPVTLRWNPVSDPSGVVYYVRLERWTGREWILEGSWYPVSASQVEDVPCSYYLYRWHVMAEDGARNYSDWSAWMYYAVPVP